MASFLALVTGPPGTHPYDVARAVASRRPRAVHVDVASLGSVVVAGAEPAPDTSGGPPSPAAVEQLFLRWLAAVAVAETYQRAGFDAVLSDHLTGDLLDDVLDILDPTPVHLVMLDGSGAPGSGPDGRGLVLDGRAPGDELAAEALSRLDEARVRPAGDGEDAVPEGSDGGTERG